MSPVKHPVVERPVLLNSLLDLLCVGLMKFLGVIVNGLGSDGGGPKILLLFRIHCVYAE